MAEENEKLELRSEVIEEILSRIPGWVLRWGITCIFIVIILLLAASWFIKYPEIISTQLMVTTQTPPASLIARANGKLVDLPVSDGEAVKEGQILAIIENAANTRDVLLLREESQDALNRMKETGFDYIEADSIFRLLDRESLELGQLQSHFSAFLQQLLQYDHFTKANHIPQKIEAIERQMSDYKTLNGKLQEQKTIIDEELVLVQRKLKSDTILLSTGIISQNEFDQSQQVYLQKKFSAKNTSVALINNNITLSEYKKSIMDLKDQFDEQSKNHRISLRESCKRLLAEIAQWEKNYLLISPISGKVSFFNFWSENEYVSNGDEIMMVVPNSLEIIGRSVMPVIGAGKVEIGQQVKIKFDEYPFDEFGAVTGIVSSISDVPRKNNYLVVVDLPNGLNTTYKKRLEFKQQMQGNAEITTKDLRLLERVFNQIRSVFETLF